MNEALIQKIRGSASELDLADLFWSVLGKWRRILVCGLILAVVVTLLGYKIVSRLNASCYQSENGGYPCVITSVTYKLSGDTDITACLDGGALAKIRYRGDLSDLESLFPGDCLTLFGTLKEPEKAGNPGEFDYREYLRSKGILYIFS